MEKKSRNELYSVHYKILSFMITTSMDLEIFFLQKNKTITGSCNIHIGVTGVVFDNRDDTHLTPYPNYSG